MDPFAAIGLWAVLGCAVAWAIKGIPPGSEGRGGPTGPTNQTERLSAGTRPGPVNPSCSTRNRRSAPATRRPTSVLSDAERAEAADALRKARRFRR